MAHLEYILEKRLYKDNGFNTAVIKRICSIIDEILCEMNKMDDDMDTVLYCNRALYNIKDVLLNFNIRPYV